ncbi:Linalool dehydratase/isomerase [Fusarium oxysporum f. sp. cubense]|uniref:Linalool dehydratase/isomerase n=1 Tax=Fusarium oxysporum f. sp. cubense TaxID=61366 RepID=A0A559LU81_FUSOC|nr:Linalool dehydratase/isomerase [Fusarium oxysporum f. sp. cubense]
MENKPRQRLALDMSKYPKLDAAQAGHLRHFHNLASQIDGEWRHMGTQEPGQEWLDAYRYQISSMTYGAGVAHYHRLPALRSVFKPLIRRLIHKMLRREVWGYWFNTSLAGNRTNPDRTVLRTPWADPIVRENIMYSGHLLLMTSLYAMLFDDNEFEQPDSLVFHWDPLFFGLGAETYRYDNRTLQAAILAEMERNGWIGVCCEPNLVFVVCNQFPIIAIRYNDVRDGTNTSEVVLEKYKKAWAEKKMVASNGLYVDWWFVEQDKPESSTQIGFTAGANAFMNTWNSDLVKSLYDKQSLGFITVIDGQVRLHDPVVAGIYRDLMDADNISPHNAAVLAQARRMSKSVAPTKFPYSQPTFGYVVQWLSEMGRTVELQGLLDFADAKLRPTWENGGLYYPRNDARDDDSGEWAHMDPFSGNAGIGYARLNVTDGQKKMWDRPWTRDFLAIQPWIDNLDLSQGVDYLRGLWDRDEKALIVTMKSWNGDEATVEPIARNLERGTWVVYVNGKLVKCDTVGQSDSLSVAVTVGAEEVHVVFQRT